MKIYILRHEDRTQDATFFSPLTEVGLENSIKLINTLEKLNINYIYSSPYIRTLQTIYPFLKKSEIKVKLDYGLSEIKNQNLIPKNSHTTRLPEYMIKSFQAEPNYRSSVEPEDIPYPEEEIDVQKRIKNFLKNLINNHGKTDDTILLVTHQIVCNIFIKIIHKYSDNKSINTFIDNYPKGALTLIFNNLEWEFIPINWKIK